MSIGSGSPPAASRAGGPRPAKSSGFRLGRVFVTSTMTGIIEGVAVESW
ncbi:hypothetical protein [Nannocystis pusilla]